ncbi:hypothetical protein GCM10009730_13270 [Streptomyces albidochromogenes]
MIRKTSGPLFFRITWHHPFLCRTFADRTPSTVRRRSAAIESGASPAPPPEGGRAPDGGVRRAPDGRPDQTGPTCAHRADEEAT